MRKPTFRKIEDILRNHSRTDKYVEKVEDEFRNSDKKVWTLSDDRRFTSLKQQRDVVEDCFNKAEEDTKIIVKALYFTRHPQFTLCGLVQNNRVHVGRQKAYNLRNEFISDVAKKLGIYDL